MPSEREQFESALGSALAHLGLDLDLQHRALMSAHYEQLIEANRQFNLTRITSPEDAALKHYADSLTLLATGWADPARTMSVLDVGTGAGFPAVPLAIACEAWSLAAIDGTGKKVRFVEASVAALGLKNVSARQARLEDLVRQRARGFNVVLVRAVGKIPELLQLLAAVTLPGGSIVFYKTSAIDEELAAAAPIASKLRLGMEIRNFELPGVGERISRKLVRYR